MIFRETVMKGVYVIDMEERGDHRGYFARSWCRREFEEHGLVTEFVQANISFSVRRGTLRGLHYQMAPYGESKLIRCTRGAVYDVVVDLRPDSPTFKRWFGVELSAESHRMLYVPERFAHGYQTLEDETEVAYQVSQFYMPESERCVRWSDPAFGIVWPLGVSVISEKDDACPDWEMV